MVKTPATQFTDEQVRELILKFLYDKWKNPTGMNSAKKKISEIRSALKQKGLAQKEVIRNLQYLIETGWVKEIVEESRFYRGTSVIPTKSVSYMITSHGIEYFDGASKFPKKGSMAGIRIENVSGVVNIGDNNYIRTESVQLFKSLDELDNRIRMTDQLTDEDKLSYRAEVKTIQSQLSKSNPDKGIIARSWGALKGIATIGSMVSIIEKVRPGIEQIIGS